MVIYAPQRILPIRFHLFKSKPYQGVEPELAHFLFIGLDANYQEDIESKIYLLYIVVTYWTNEKLFHYHLQMYYIIVLY